MERITTEREAKRKLRHETSVWQLAAVGMFILSLFANITLSTMYEIERHNWEVENNQIKRKLEYAQSVQEQAIQELGELSNQIYEDKIERLEQAKAYAYIGAYIYIGECTITYYCPCEECCGRWADGITASGIPAGPGIVAVDKDIIPLGSTVIIDGQKYLAADTGSSVKGLHIDICVADHNTAISSGVTTENVWIENK